MDMSWLTQLLYLLDLMTTYTMQIRFLHIIVGLLIAVGADFSVTSRICTVFRKVILVCRMLYLESCVEFPVFAGWNVAPAFDGATYSRMTTLELTSTSLPLSQ